MSLENVVINSSMPFSSIALSKSYKGITFWNLNEMFIERIKELCIFLNTCNRLLCKSYDSAALTLSLMELFTFIFENSTMIFMLLNCVLCWYFGTEFHNAIHRIWHILHLPNSHYAASIDFCIATFKCACSLIILAAFFELGARTEFHYKFTTFITHQNHTPSSPTSSSQSDFS